MKLLLSCIAAGAAVIALAQSSFAVLANCQDQAFPTTAFNNKTFTCPPSSGTFNAIRSVATISGSNPLLNVVNWTYRTDMQIGPTSASPVAAAALINNNSQFALDVGKGTLCPEGVDNTVNNGPGSGQQCQTEGAFTPRSARSVRIFHSHI